MAKDNNYTKLTTETTTHRIVMHSHHLSGNNAPSQNQQSKNKHSNLMISLMLSHRQKRQLIHK